MLYVGDALFKAIRSGSWRRRGRSPLGVDTVVGHALVEQPVAFVERLGTDVVPALAGYEQPGGYLSMSDPVSSTTERTSAAQRVSMIVANPGILELTGWLIVDFWAPGSPTRGTSCARQATT